MSALSEAGGVPHGASRTHVPLPPRNLCVWWVLWLARPPAASASSTSTDFFSQSQLSSSISAKSSPLTSPCMHVGTGVHSAQTHWKHRSSRQEDTTHGAPTSALGFDLGSPVPSVTVESLKDKDFCLFHVYSILSSDPRTWEKLDKWLLNVKMLYDL